MSDIEAHQRAHERTRALKGASIIFNNRSSVIDCTVRNISPTGGKLVLTSPAALPDRFELRFADGSEQRCEVRWRTLSELGVVFLKG